MRAVLRNLESRDDKKLYDSEPSGPSKKKKKRDLGFCNVSNQGPLLMKRRNKGKAITYKFSRAAKRKTIHN